MAVNPLIRLFLKNDKIYLENILTLKTFEVDSSILRILNNFPAFSNTKDKAITAVIQSLKENLIILDDRSYRRISNEYLDWEKYDWWISLLYYLSTEDVHVVDKISSKRQSEILKRYIRKEIPSFYKKYKTERIPLKRPDRIKGTNLVELLFKRRTLRNFRGSIKFGELSNILHYSCKEVTALRNLQIKNYKENPKALLKSLYSPFEIYLIVNNVSGLSQGIYHLDLADYSLNVLKIGDYSKRMAEIAQGQMFIADAPVVILISAIFKRYMFRYRQARAYRDILTTAAELAQLIIIYSTYFDIKAFETPALKDTEIQNLLELEAWEEEILYLLALGR